MRIPAALRDAAALAVRELGVAASTTALTSAALRATLEAAWSAAQFCTKLALDTNLPR